MTPQISPERFTCRSLNILLGVALIFAVAGIAAFFVDIQVARYFADHRLPGELDDVVQLSEAFAHGWGAAIVILSVYILDPAKRRSMLRMVATVLLAVAAIHIAKLIVVRSRPRNYGHDGVWDFPEQVWDTFHPMTLQLSTAAESSLQSWPSGHTATAVGLAVALSWFYPRGKWLFAGLATLSALQRISVNAHFVSDTLFAVALSLCAVQLCHRGWLGRWYDRVERRPAEQGHADKL